MSHTKFDPAEGPRLISPKPTDPERVNDAAAIIGEGLHRLTTSIDHRLAHPVGLDEDCLVLGRVIAKSLTNGDEQCPDRCGGVAGHSGPHQSSDYVGTEDLRTRTGVVIGRWYRAGLLRFNSHDDGSDDLLLRDEIVRAIRD